MHDFKDITGVSSGDICRCRVAVVTNRDCIGGDRFPDGIIYSDDFGVCHRTGGRTDIFPLDVVWKDCDTRADPARRAWNRSIDFVCHAAYESKILLAQSYDDPGCFWTEYDAGYGCIYKKSDEGYTCGRGGWCLPVHDCVYPAVWCGTRHLVFGV